MHTLINADCLDYLNGNPQTWTTIFADPPDNIGLGYETYKDKLPDHQYVDLLETWLHLFVHKAKTVWFSFNAKWTFEVGHIVAEMVRAHQRLGGQALRPDLHFWPTLSPRSWKQPSAPPADSAGTMPHCSPTPSACRVGGSRTATSEPTRAGVSRATYSTSPRYGQLKGTSPMASHAIEEGLVEQCIALTTAEGDSVLDPFGGTGTTLRVCKRINRHATLVELDSGDCAKIAEEHGMIRSAYIHRAMWEAAS